MDISTMTGDMLREEVKRLQEENRELQNELVNGIHTCGPKCRKTPRCAQIADLREELAEYKTALAKVGPYYIPATCVGDDEAMAVYAAIDKARKGEGEK